MKNSFIPIEKQSKKVQREYYSRQRNDWHGVNPCLRTFSDKKKFSKAKRAKDKAALRSGFYFF